MPVTRDVAVPLREIVVRASRSSGPGGQHANVTASRVEASFDVAASSALSDAQKARIVARCGPVVRAVAQDARGQARNRELALERLRARPRARARRPPSAPDDRPDERLEGAAARGQAPHVGAQARPPPARARGLISAPRALHRRARCGSRRVVEDGDRWGACGHRPVTTGRPRGGGRLLAGLGRHYSAVGCRTTYPAVGRSSACQRVPRTLRPLVSKRRPATTMNMWLAFV